MRIRCERCATTYELDEKRLPPHGALVKCTRCDHVFRAAPPGPASEAAAAAVPAPASPDGGRASGEERTAVFGYAAAEQEERTAPIPDPSRPVTSRAGEARTGAAAPQPHPARAPAGKGATEGRRVGWWLLAALLLAVAAGLGWYLLQSRVATPTTRLPAGALFLPT